MTNTGGSFHAEVFYRFNVSDNISFTPGVIFVSDVADTGEDLFIPVLRTSFRF
ncbi:carbohydrate porin [Thermoleptolyngbya sichuanensis]|uniref:carbohydrate porin n=1 Tax=Thermoleptolyngbya sichuanensis TaxID=2885951 RepID=UPI003527BF60